jgi:hypothetical protein
MDMSGKPVHKLRPPPVYDYSSAIAKAVEWLGDRYLLAKPINATPQSPSTRGRQGTRLRERMQLSAKNFL